MTKFPGVYVRTRSVLLLRFTQESIMVFCVTEKLIIIEE